MRNFLTRLVTEEDGAELLEFVLIAALLVIACAAAIKLFASALNEQFEEMGNTLG